MVFRRKRKRSAVLKEQNMTVCGMYDPCNRPSIKEWKRDLDSLSSNLNIANAFCVLKSLTQIIIVCRIIALRNGEKKL